MAKKERKIFFVVASGGHDIDTHYHDTIKNKRSIEEISRFLNSEESERLRKYLHNQPCVVWGAVPGKSNTRTWGVMEPGDYVMIYKRGRIILAAEVAMKVKNPELARHFWREDQKGQTWELAYFLVNEAEVNVRQKDLNRYLGYSENYLPHGFMAVDQKKANKLLSHYGDLLSLLQKLEKGQELEEIDVEREKEFDKVIDEEVEKAPTEHDEMQWRLIRLGTKAHFDVWVPIADQGKKYEGNVFRDFVIREFQEAVDVPSYVKNIDTVWKLGLSIKAAFEIEHSTQIFSGILRLSDLRALAPNSNYPLFIVADREKKSRVFSQLERPTFSNDYLRLDEVVKFLSYSRVRELDEEIKKEIPGFGIDWLVKKAEAMT